MSYCLLIADIQKPSNMPTKCKRRISTCLRKVMFCIISISWLQINYHSALAFLQTRTTRPIDRQHQRSHPSISLSHVNTLPISTLFLQAEAQESQPSRFVGTASVPTLVISLVKSIVGAGVLALPASIAGLGQDFASAALLWPALLVVIVMGCINSYFFSLVGRVCRMTGATSYQDAWDKTVEAENSIEPKEKSSLVALVVTLKTVLSCLAFSIILADSFQSIAVASGLPDATRGQALAAVTTLLLLPLCTLLKDLKALAPVSFLGLVGVGTTMASMIYRCLDGSYRVGGEFALSPNAQRPLESPGTGSFFQNINILGGLVLACTLATAFVAHYNAPRFYNELENNTEKRFDTVVTWSYIISGIAFMIVASAGFLTFGQACNGFILNSYSPFDPLITVSRVALAISIALTYPLPFFGLRDGVLDIMQVPMKQRNNNDISVLSVGLLLGVTVMAYLVKDVALVLSVGGGTFSTAISSVIPALMFRSAVKQQETNSRDNGEIANPKNAFDAKLALVLMWICVAIGALGVFFALE
jgi:amino acid permease